MREDAQSFDLFNVPVNRKVFDAGLNAQLEEVSGGKKKEIGIIYEEISGGKVQISSTTNVYTAEDITEEKAAEYFNGSKTAEQVTALINNRVQLYLDEIH